MSETLYLPIKLNDTVLPKVGVFIPQRLQPTTAVNLIVYFHGNIAAFCQTEPQPFSRRASSITGAPRSSAACARSSRQARPTQSCSLRP